MGNLLPQQGHRSKGERKMNTIERKVTEMTTRFGRDMAISQAAFHVSRARGAVRQWWQQVLLSLQRSSESTAVATRIS